MAKTLHNIESSLRRPRPRWQGKLIETLSGGKELSRAWAHAHAAGTPWTGEGSAEIR